MSRRVMGAALILTVVTLLSASTGGVFFGENRFWFACDPIAGSFDAADLQLDLSYTIGGVEFSSESVIAYPGTWVWQGFTAQGDLGAYAFESSILFGASTAECLYVGAIASLSIGGINFTFHAAQLGDVIIGGPEGGCALQLSTGLLGLGLVSVTEFGAAIEDGDYDGISIIHIRTGLEQHYKTDPRPVGAGFTGQKLSLRRDDIFCADSARGTLYMSCEGFEYVKLELKGLELGLPFVTLDSELSFALEDKTLSLAPSLPLGEFSCLEFHGKVDWDEASMAIKGIELSGLELDCYLGPVRIHDVALFDLNEYVLTTERFGSRVMGMDDALDLGCDFYPDYWQLLSIEVAGDTCCGTYSVLANAYFSKDSGSLFDLAKLHLQASAQLTVQLDLTLELDAKPSGVDHIAFGLGFSW